jgi:hypothetical protein
MRHQLREVTQDDVCSALSQLRGHRSLFGFAKRRRLVFRDPTSRLHAGRFPARAAADDRRANRRRAARRGDPRAAAHRRTGRRARRPRGHDSTVDLDDIDLAGHRICPDGHEQPLSPFMHQVLVCWLQHRQRTWPDTRNGHVLLSAASATSLRPVSNYSLMYHLLRHGVQLELIRGDRVLQEALVSGADPLQLAEAFNLSSATAVAYANIARSLLEGAIEGAPAAGQPGA